ncbi:hypothetical protein [Klebsiella michiganensis]|uniref:hypothetical protein n=1 Tax=Enterobacteriaceae TaxID=543 RepID=UPI0012B8D007|nr:MULTISPECIES: hypothetical protein [Enterobacteriaceae]MBE4816621.1 hypothetical protein [Enterobacter cloacae complex sp. P41C]MBE4849797.1 hypothetical protein [Enterobacter cloacae complex sp. P41RS]HBM3161055.1 hypothetical protein [Klebsiella michiganensis]HED2214192.1 hypothetical protein [Klebsiella pneumoniae]
MKPTVQTSNRFLFLTGNEDFTIRKTAAAKIARARGQRFFVHICKRHGASEHYSSCMACVECKRHGASEHYSSCMACVECQKQWYRDNGKRKQYPEIKPFSSAYTIAAVFFKGIRL